MSNQGMINREQIRWVYFMRIKSTDELVKIGWSQKPVARLVEVGRMCPFEVALVTGFRGDRGAEKALHIKYAANHVHGEWFKLSGALQCEIDDIERRNSPVPWGSDAPKTRTLNTINHSAKRGEPIAPIWPSLSFADIRRPPR